MECIAKDVKPVAMGHLVEGLRHFKDGRIPVMIPTVVVPYQHHITVITPVNSTWTQPIVEMHKGIFFLYELRI